jgi:hypothetical protein
MKNSLQFSILFILFFAVSCSLTPPQKTPQDTDSVATEIAMTSISTSTETPTPQPVPLTIDLFKNVKISALELKKEVQLSEGKWSEVQADGSIQMVMLDEHFATGDLNSDGVDDAVVITAESMGGTGVFYSVVAFLNENGTYVQKGSAFIDDRPIVHSLEIKNGEIILNVNVHGLNDPMVNPTVKYTKTYRLYVNRLITFRQTQQLDDGKVREINITYPEDSTEVSGEVTLTGNMPIAPFENTLLVQVFGIKTNTSFANSMMVDAADVGMPATFLTKVSLDKFTPGELVIIQLVEVSMADGSSMTLDSVIVRVK